MPSYNDCIVVPFGLSELAGAARTLGVLAYADGQYQPAMAAAPVQAHTVFTAHSRNGKYVACMRCVLSAEQYPPSVSFSSREYQVDVYETDGWTLLCTIPVLEGGSTLPNCMVVSNAGVVALAANNDGVRVFDALNQVQLAVLRFNGPPVTYQGSEMANVLAFSPADDYLFVARISYGIAAFKVSDWTRDADMKLDASFYDPVTTPDPLVMSSPINWVQFSPSGDAVYFFGPEHGLRGKTWPGLEALTLPALTQGGTHADIGFTPDGKHLYYTKTSDGAVATLYKVQLSDPDAEAQKVLVSEPVFGSDVAIALSLSADGRNVCLMGYGDSARRNQSLPGAQTTAIMLVADTQDGSVSKKYEWTMQGFLSNAFGRFALWLPLAKLQLVTGIIKDAEGAGVARDVLLTPRSKDSLLQPQWTQSDVNGRFKVAVATKDELLSRVVFDSTGKFNDLIDKVQV